MRGESEVPRFVGHPWIHIKRFQHAIANLFSGSLSLESCCLSRDRDNLKVRSDSALREILFSFSPQIPALHQAISIG